MTEVRYLLTSEACRDLTDIVTFVAADGNVAARQLLDEFERAFRRLAENPGIGRRRPEFSPDSRVRSWTLFSYLIIYLIIYLHGTSPLRIARIVHGARDSSGFEVRDRITDLADTWPRQHTLLSRQRSGRVSRPAARQPAVPNNFRSASNSFT